MGPADRLFHRLEQYAPLPAGDRAALLESLTADREFAPREDLVHERRPVEGVYLILEGFACRYKLLPDGRRQIVGLLLPGDICDMRVFLLRRMDHSICALSHVRAKLLPVGNVATLVDHHPRLARALWWLTTVEDSITREWVVNVGYRSAFQRVAHLFCEIFTRLESVGLTQGSQCPFPLTQIELGDALALSSVHVNRTLMYMRRCELLQLQQGTLHILDRNALQNAAGFDPLYLHLRGANPASMQLSEQSMTGSRVQDDASSA